MQQNYSVTFILELVFDLVAVVSLNDI